MAAAPNHYESLGVPEDAPAEAIRHAYRRRIQETHPDRAADEDDRERRTAAASIVNAAKTVLLDPAKRAAYDMDLYLARRIAPGPLPSSRPSAPGDPPASSRPSAPAPARGSLADLGLRRRRTGNLDASIAFVRWNGLGQWLALAVVIVGANWLVPFFNRPDRFGHWTTPDQIVAEVAFAWLFIGAAWSRSRTEHPLGRSVRLALSLARGPLSHFFGGGPAGAAAGDRRDRADGENDREEPR